jgi:hypothetical protein
MDRVPLYVTAGMLGADLPARALSGVQRYSCFQSVQSGWVHQIHRIAIAVVIEAHARRMTQRIR